MHEHATKIIYTIKQFLSFLMKNVFDNKLLRYFRAHALKMGEEIYFFGRLLFLFI